MPKSTLQHEIRQKRAFDHPAAEAYLNLMRTHCVLTAIQASVFKDFGLSAPLYNILRILRGAGKDGIRVQEIGDRMITREPDTTRLVDRLEKAGLAKRERTTEDRRVVLVHITDPGLKLLDRMEAPVRDSLDRMLGHMNRKDLDSISRLMEAARAPHGPA